MAPQPKTLLESMEDKVLLGDDCWEWTGGKTLGYGRMRLQDQNYRAHRVMYELLVGPIPEGMCLDHLCKNRGCVRPDHLEPVTLAENTLRGEGRGAKNARMTHCGRGHEFTPDNTHTHGTRRRCRTCQHDYYVARRGAK